MIEERPVAEAGHPTSPRCRDARRAQRALHKGLLSTLAALTLLGSGLAAAAATVAAGSSTSGNTRLVARLASSATAAGRTPGGVLSDAPVILIRRAHVRIRRAKQRRESAERAAITTQPRSETVVANRLASFTVSASGTPAPTTHWQRSTNHGRTWTTIAAARQVTYSFRASAAESGDRYRAVFSNRAGSATSGAAILSVRVRPTGFAPQVTTQPPSESVASGASATFTAAASGSPAPSVLWEVSSNDGRSWTDVAGAISPSYSFLPSAAQSGDQYRAVFSNQTGSATTSAVTLIVAEETANWSGYVAAGDAFSNVSASWTVPSVTCGAETTSYSSQWIGIDGYNSDTVEQDGTEVDCWSGTPHYGAWYEMFGDEAAQGGDEVPLPSASYPVSPGDAMTASVSNSGSIWTLAIADQTEDWNYAIPIPSGSPAPDESSAEWIVERPCVGSLSALPDFGGVSFTNASAADSTTSGPISAFSFQPLDMLGSTLLAVPGALDPTGGSFTDTWQAGS